MSQQIYITNIQKFSTHDGPGIRTNVFFKGCELHCKWCANPENIKRFPQLLYHKTKCIGCRKCVSACPNNAIEFNNGVPEISVSKCTNCGICSKQCIQGALSISGKIYTPQEVFDIVNQDKPFYKNSNGGVTFSGGEPLLFPEFILPIAEKCKAERYNTAVETCGYFDLSKCKELIDLIDYFLFDIKLINDTKHMKYCCKSNALIHKNFEYLINSSKSIIPRIPIIPGVNDTPDDISNLLTFLSNYKDELKEIHLLPYHTLGCCKYEQLRVPYNLPDIQPPSDEYMKNLQKELSSGGLNIIIGG